MSESNKSYWRQQDLCPVIDEPITLVGVGGIGSPTALILSKMGCTSLSVYDHDIVEDHNVPNQLYGPDDVGKLKVEALSDWMDWLTGEAVAVGADAYDPELFPDPIMILAVDSMKTRKAIWDGCKDQEDLRLFIDARMGAEMGRILAVDLTNPKHPALYEQTLYTDDQAVEAPCTARAIAYTGFGLAALIAHLLKRRAKGQSVPFDTVIDFPTMTWLTDAALVGQPVEVVAADDK